MPITCRIDDRSRIFFSQWSGDILPAVLEKYWTELGADPAAAKANLHLVDVREARFLLTGPELWRRVDEQYREIVGARPIKIALVLADEQQERVVRKWSSLLPRTVASKAFYEHAQAMAWLTGLPHFT